MRSALPNLDPTSARQGSAPATKTEQTRKALVEGAGPPSRGAGGTCSTRPDCPSAPAGIRGWCPPRDRGCSSMPADRPGRTGGCREGLDGFSRNEADRPGQGLVPGEPPARWLQPLAGFADAVDVAVAEVGGELTGHERGHERLGMCGVGPE